LFIWLTENSIFDGATADSQTMQKNHKTRKTG